MTNRSTKYNINHCTLHFSGASSKLGKEAVSFAMSVSVRPSARPSACSHSAPIARIFTKFDIAVFFRKSVGKKLSRNANKMQRVIEFIIPKFRVLDQQITQCAVIKPKEC